MVEVFGCRGNHANLYKMGLKSCALNYCHSFWTINFGTGLVSLNYSARHIFPYGWIFGCHGNHTKFSKMGLKSCTSHYFLSFWVINFNLAQGLFLLNLNARHIYLPRWFNVFVCHDKKIKQSDIGSKYCISNYFWLNCFWSSKWLYW